MFLAVALSFSSLALAGDAPKKPAATKTEEKSVKPAENVRRDLLSGKVVLLGQELRKRGIKVAGEMDKQVVLVTDGGELVPIAADWRGRAFYQDKRLRGRNVELIVRRRPGIPYAQILMVYTFDKKGKRQYTDYWCDICAIPMYEIKECECCQGEVELRFQNQPLPSYITKQLRREAADGKASGK